MFNWEENPNQNPVVGKKFTETEIGEAWSDFDLEATLKHLKGD